MTKIPPTQSNSKGNSPQGGTINMSRCSKFRASITLRSKNEAPPLMSQWVPAPPISLSLCLYLSLCVLCVYIYVSFSLSFFSSGFYHAQLTLILRGCDDDVVVGVWSRGIGKGDASPGGATPDGWWNDFFVLFTGNCVMVAATAASLFPCLTLYMQIWASHFYFLFILEKKKLELSSLKSQWLPEQTP